MIRRGDDVSEIRMSSWEGKVRQVGMTEEIGDVILRGDDTDTRQVAGRKTDRLYLTSDYFSE